MREQWIRQAWFLADHFRGAREAVDEYFAGKQVFLNRIDYTGRLVVKPLP